MRRRLYWWLLAIWLLPMAAAVADEFRPALLEITETDPGLKGDTAQGGTKPATLSTGAVVKVPLFINTGDVLKIDTRTGEYVERVKK